MTSEAPSPATRVEVFVMPLLLINDEERKVFPKSVQIPADRNEQAIKNHSQMLVRQNTGTAALLCSSVIAAGIQPTG